MKVYVIQPTAEKRSELEVVEKDVPFFEGENKDMFPTPADALRYLFILRELQNIAKKLDTLSR